MFTQFKQKLVARLTKFAYLIVPCGSVIPMMATEIQEGYLVINGQNVYEAEHKRLYDVLAKNNNLSKGSDGKGNYVKLPDPNGRCIELTSNVSFVGKLLAAALPNITGQCNIRNFEGDSWKDIQSAPWAEGAIDATESQKYDRVKVQDLFNGDQSCSKVTLDASRSSSLYNGSKIQVPALQLLACIRC